MNRYKTVFYRVIGLLIYTASMCYAQETREPLLKGSVDYIKTVLDSRIMFQQQRYDDAIPLLTDVVAANPDHFESWNMLGIIYMSKHQYRLAENAFTQAVNVNPGYLPAYQGLATAQEALGKYRTALNNYQFFINNFEGTDDLASFRTAELLTRFGKYYDALPLYDTLRTNENSPFQEKSQIYYNNIHRKSGQYTQQRTILEGIPYIVPQYNNCMPSAFAAVLIYWGEPITDQELSHDLLDTQEGSFTIDMIDYARKLGYVAILCSGTFEELMAWIDKGVPVITTQVITGVNNLPVIHARTIYGYDLFKESVYTSDTYQMPTLHFINAWKKAEYMMTIIVPKTKSNLIPAEIRKDMEYLARADRFFVQEKYEQAYQYYIEAEIENEHNTAALLGQAKSLAKLERIEEAVRQLQAILEYDDLPQRIRQETLFVLGIINFNRHDRQSAYKYLKKCIEIATPSIPEAHNFLGYIYEEEGEYDEAIHEYQIALHLKPSYMNAHYNLARTYAQTGNSKECIDHLELCIANNFISYEDIVTDPVFNDIKDTPEFRNIAPIE